MDSVIFETPKIRWERRFPTQEHQVMIPEGVTDGVPKDIYDQYRAGRDSACVDLMVATKRHGKPAVLLSKRKTSVCYGGKWWMYGGALQSYASIEAFIAERVRRECGVDITGRCKKALVGVYRTASSDHIGSTLQPCYAAWVDENELASILTDDAHDVLRIFTPSDIDALPENETHWYPMRVARKVLASM